ncbi:MAG: hypothetical protein Q4C41_05580 [Eggerthellaceae bacterium]|nr:hypothetical protein [Eggerthellaceae bacterium]
MPCPLDLSLNWFSFMPCSSEHAKRNTQKGQQDLRYGLSLSLADGLHDFYRSVDPDGRKALKASRNLEAYKRAVVLRTWRDNPECAKLVLDHTNAFYVRKDDAPRKGADKDTPYILCEICIDDPLVRSEVNFRQEMLRLDLAYEGLHFDELRIKPSKFGMKDRHPFTLSLEEIVAFRQQGVPRSAALSPSKASDNLETVKRAFCLTFGERAEDVLDTVCAAALEQVNFGERAARRHVQRFWLHLYIAEPQFAHMVKTFSPALVENARLLGLRVHAVQVHDAPESLAGRKAFPRCGAPHAFKDVLSRA